MGKIGYLIKRVSNMNFKNMFDTVDFVHEKNGKNKLLILIDIVSCGIKYQAGYMDYKIFEMYNLNKEQRKTIITRGFNNELVRKYNNQQYVHYLHNKLEFNQKFNKYLRRDWMELKEDNFDEFEKFTKNHSKIIVKPVAEQCGKGIEIIEVNEKNIQKVYKDLLETKRYLIEEIATQCKEISSLHPTSINTIRAVTLNNHIVAAYLRIGNHNNVVDNFNHGGLAAPITIETGTIDYLAIDKAGNIHEKHPLTKKKIVGFKIPDWDNIKEYVENVSREIPEVGYVGWDVCVSEKGPLLIEGNEFPGHDIYQLPPHRSNGIGMKPRFIKAMQEGEK